MKKLLPICILFFFTILGYEVASTFTSLYLKQTGVKEIVIGFIFSLWPLFVIIFAPFAGKLSDRIGRKLLIISASVGYSLFGFLSFMHLFVFAFIILGLSNAFLWTVGRAYVFDIAKGTKAKEVGIFFFSAILGSILGTPLSGWLVESIGYIKTFFIGGLIVLIGAVAGLFLKESKRSIKTMKTEVSKDFVLLGIVALILAFSPVATKIFLPILMGEIGFGTFTIGAVLFVTKIFFAASQFIGMKVYNTFGSRLSIIGGCSINSFGLFVVGFAVTLPEFLLAGVLGGIGSGISSLVTQTFISRITKAYGFGSGIFEVATNLGQFIGTWGSGVLVETFGIRELFYFSALITFFAGAIFLLIKK
ncbi:MAG: MFS transporter [Candidatus Micrarchaeota archaeon]|nr:MFS transporter [Candidatus Micrarchaeota archaeon]